MKLADKLYALPFILLLSITLTPVVQANAQDQASESMRALAIRVSISAVTATKLKIGELVDLFWVSNPELDESGAQKPSIVRFIAGDLRLLALQQPQSWQESETGFSAVVTISVDADNLSIFLNAPKGGRYVIAATE